MKQGVSGVEVETAFVKMLLISVKNLAKCTLKYSRSVQF